jgi:hypothetical protein
MRFRIRIVVLLVAAAAGPVGCGSKDESKPNPEFKAPDIPPGKRTGPGPDPNGVKPPGR